MIAGKKFCNKIWNATRFVLLQIGNSQFPISNFQKNFKFQISNFKLTIADKKIVNGLKKTTAEVSGFIEKYEFGQALHKLYDFFWHEYADVYIETAKKQIAQEKLKESTQNILLKIHLDLLKLLHPFLPFITEEIWQSFGGFNNSKSFLIIESWPK